MLLVPLSRTFVLFLCILSIDASPSTPSPTDVIVVANINSPESLKLAKFYQHARQIPENNLIYVKTKTDPQISHQEFVADILHPLRKQLIKRGFIDAHIDPLSRDTWGRFAFQPFATHFKYLVVCMGIPLKIQEHPNPKEGDLPSQMPVPFRKTHASVDSELALLTAENYGYTGPITNPLFHIASPTRLDYTSAISVSRLDGPSLCHAQRLVTDAIAAESNNFVPGRAYIDLNHHHPDGNLWLREAATFLRLYGYDVETIPPSLHWSFHHRHDAPAIYLGWYQTHAQGPMLPPQQIPTGSIAAHIHSYSAGTIHCTHRQWVGPLIDAGFAVTFGNVNEPYLQLTLRPDLFVDLLLQGFCVGDASLYAQPYLSWQHVTIGDPLYQPFKPKATWDPVAILQNPESDPYQRIIALNRIAINNRNDAAEYAIESHIHSPNLPVAFKILEDYPKLIDPLLLNRIKDYLASQQLIDSSVAPLFLNFHQKLVEAGEILRSETILQLMQKNQTQWHPELQSQVLKRSETYPSATKIESERQP